MFSLLPLPSVLVANPHWYDYLHFLDVKPDGQLKMVDGGGQVINAKVRGQFSMIPLSDTQAEITFTQLANYNPYQKNNPPEPLPDFKTTITKEQGVFLFRQEVIWRIADPDDHPYLMYRTRYVFEVDPLACVADHQRGNLYHLTENKDFLNSVCIYYARHDQQELTFKQVKNLDFDPAAF